ncbi:isocitrate lyase/PEP mutase family protein [Curtobacterium sp. VKM Ac-1393]|uniref:isocitrate lyase/PEP mutase family protein n=1 Tax=Curtobacterium sp. VKM Ac-1393 TaxID=2783814 RepID=UPI00188A6FBC|nr:isocitrate lyase/phosphoenolpyruvate mutase family protein [Curtobacterium sp. VKM Ac-1393]MBF4606536.1 isocitrate lyase/phosphoenolpyruvate mutase family protein [Curtobacterium sp. VKM Ac-1393]
MNHTTTAAATRFHSLHRDPEQPLVLANAWDVASARLIEAAGAPAIATTSAGVAWSLGRPDGNVLSREEALGAITRITAAVSVPVTVDIEGGYADDADGVERTVDAVLEAGAVGINIEDGASAPSELVDRIAAARRAGERAGVRLFVNARTDVHLAGLVAPELLLTESIDRANRYLDAGADGVFVPGIGDLSTISALVEAISAPLNVMAGPGSPSVAELAAVGVARVSLGSGVAQAAYAVARHAAIELLTAGTCDSTAQAVGYGEVNALF